jgi:hypothetical protein
VIPILYDFEKYRADLTEGEAVVGAKVKLGEGFYNYVLVQNPIHNPDGTVNAINVFVGTSTRQRFELVPGADTGWWPMDNLNDVWARSLSGADVTITYVLCRLAKRK